jgi:hypothetical protein
MANSSRQTSLFGVNDWKSIYKNYSQADFQSYDYETLRKSMVDYLRTNYPETFNDYVESSEYVALLDVIAFMGQGLAFRNDLNTRENFIDTAERRDSVVKLAKLVGYTPKRNLAAHGYLKITAISTTEQVKDVNNFSLNNVTVLWNDPANVNWQEQFNAIINAALVDGQRVGRPGHSTNILEVKTDEYSVRIPPNASPVAPFGAIVDGNNMTFECVSVSSVGSTSLKELSPGLSSVFNLLYRNDKLGYSSANTGFFVYFKEGTLQQFPFSFDSQIENQTVDVAIQGINNDDVWLYEYDPITLLPTEWKKAESVFASQSTSATRKLFSVTSGYNDQITCNFGDGVFGEMPVGNFAAYVRSSNGLSYVIDPSEMQGTTVTISYISKNNRTEKLTLSLELMLPNATAQSRETLTDIKVRAPQRYYTQNRMVNGEDYNNFPFTMFNSIVKSKAINRSSVGVSRNFDLADPTGKYSSTNDFAEDGGLYMDRNDDFVTFVASTTNDIIKFLTRDLATALGGHRAYQYYAQAYSRYDINTNSGDGVVYWNQTIYSADSSSGYFYKTGNAPVPVGVVAGNNIKYLSVGSMIKFVAPSGKYFDKNNKLVSGLAGPSDITYIWTSVATVVGDGSNSGVGNLPTGDGPITLTNYIPDGAILASIIPSFTNEFSSDLTQEIVNNIILSHDFALVYDNTLLASQERWSVQSYNTSSYFVRFRCLGYGKYIVSYRSVSYYFGSVSDIRFTFERNRSVYDPTTGKVAQDSITILKTNSQYGNNYPLPREVMLSVVGQTIETDGYVDDFSVEVSLGDITTNNRIKDPDFFTQVTGYQFNTRNTLHFTFFKIVTDVNKLTRVELVPSSSVVYNYGTQADIAVVKYEFPVGQLFYAVLEDKFYQSVNDATAANIVNLQLLTNYSVKIGRQGLYFQYKHISSDSHRVDPATSTVIDMYFVTQDYLTKYTNWLRDTTNTISEPLRPTIAELSDAYSSINDYKMLTDSVILNSVRFKPLFGSKAEPSLRATIKVIKSSKTNASDSEIRSAIITEMNNYFSIDNWDFGDTFYFSELSAYLHSALGDLISSAVLVPNDPSLSFGDLYEIKSAPYEIFTSAAQASDINVISALTSSELQIAG